jgi:hypothetical protein
MAEIVSSAVVQELVSKVLSCLVQKYEEKEASTANRNLERLEMAHIRLEAALETSEKWQITDPSLLRWRKKLKLAAQECDDTLHKCKHRILVEEQMEQEVTNSAFAKRLAHATKSFILSVFGCNDTALCSSVVQRFEWFADGASKFMRFVEFGGTRYPQMTFNSLVKHLFAGKKLRHRISRGHGGSLFLLCLVPITTTEHGIEATLSFIHQDSSAPEDNFVLTAILQVSESTDIVGILIKCLQLFTPHFKSTIEIIRKQLTQLPIQDLSWVPYVDSCQCNLHSLISTQWFRPNPLCCKKQDQHKLCRSSKLYTLGSLDVSLEPVIGVFLRGRVSLSEYNKRWTSLSECKNSPKVSSYLKVGIGFTPHSSLLEDMLPAGTSSALAEVEGEEQQFLHSDITLEQLEEIMLPKAIDYFQQNAEATVYQMLWKSKHGDAYIQVEKASTDTRRTSMRTCRNFQGARKRKMLQQHDLEIDRQIHVTFQFLSLWAAQAPIQLRGSIVDWIKKKESQFVTCVDSKNEEYNI